MSVVIDAMLKVMRAGTRQDAIHGCQGCADHLLEDAASVIERLQHSANLIAQARTLVDEQVKYGWAEIVPRTPYEEMLRDELRKLHALIRGDMAAFYKLAHARSATTETGGAS